eukprot:13327592-Alexandrium_andersonii.AAC.1
MPPRMQATREEAAGPAQQSNPQSAAAALSKRPESGGRSSGSRRGAQRQNPHVPYTVKGKPISPSESR